MVGVPRVRGLGTGIGHMMALTEAGTVFSWGDTTFGTLGRPEGNTKTPAIIPSLSGVQSILTHNSTNLATLANGRIMTWGGVRPWTRPEGSHDDIASYPILLWLDGLDQP